MASQLIAEVGRNFSKACHSWKGLDYPPGRSARDCPGEGRQQLQASPPGEGQGGVREYVYPEGPALQFRDMGGGSGETHGG